MEIFLGAFTREWEQRRAAFLHERLIGGEAVNEDERRRRGAAAVAGPGYRTNGFANAGREGAARRRPAPRPMATRFAGLAGGSQPSVVKMTSFGGGGRLGAMAGYISRNGDVPMENEAGSELRGRDAIGSLCADWAHLIGNRAESRDIATFRIDVAGGPVDGKPLHAWARGITKTALGDRSFAFAVEERQGHSRIDGVAVLRDRVGERLTADAKAEEIVRARMQRQGGPSTEFHFTGFGNGVEYGTARLRKLVEKAGGAVENERGERLGDAKQAGDLVQLRWRSELHSRKPRDVMHLVMSARAGTDVDAFHASAREFLAAEFPQYRYVFSLHDPSKDTKALSDGGKRPHVHVHAIIVMRSEGGERVETSIRSFRRWREGLAEQARAHGIRMEMTDRRDLAAAASYTRNQVRPISRDGRTEHEGISESAAQRYDRKRREVATTATSIASCAYTETVRQEWNAVAREAGNIDAREFAKDQISRINLAHDESDHVVDSSLVRRESGSHFRTVLVRLSKLAEIDNMSTMTRSEFEAYEKRVETALFRAERIMPETERSNFEEIAAAAREHVGVRRDMMEQAEQTGDRVADNASPRRDDDDRRWDEAVARHGLRLVEAGNDVMLEVEYARERIELAKAGEIQVDRASLQASLSLELARAAELGVAGNSYIREIAEVDEELRAAIVAAERSRQRTMERGERTGGRDEELRSVDAWGHRADGDGERERSSNRADEVKRTDPAKQHLTRLEELQRETDKDREQHEPER